MQNLKMWAKGKPPLIALSAVQLVTFSDSLYEVLPQAKDRRLFGRQFALPDDIHIWHRMYQNPLKPFRAFVRMITKFSDSGNLIYILFSAGRWLHRVLKRNPDYFRDNPPKPEDVREGAEFLKEIYAKVFAELKEDLDPQPFDSETKARFTKYLKENEQALGFFFFLIVPSLLIFQTSPYILYRKAINGDIDAIEKLLKLDPLSQGEPAIFLQIQKINFATNKRADYERVTAAVHKLAVTDYGEIDEARKRSKVELAAIISALSRFGGKRFTSTTILNLFKAYARDKEKGGTEYDLPAGIALTKAIQRHGKTWNELFQNLDN